ELELLVALHGRGHGSRLQAEQRQAGCEPDDPDRIRRPPTRGLQPVLMLPYRSAAGGPDFLSGLCVPELLRQQPPSGVSLERPRGRHLAAEAVEEEAEDRRPHLCAVAMTLEPAAEPGACPRGAARRELVPLEPLHAREVALRPHSEQEAPALGRPCRPGVEV